MLSSRRLKSTICQLLGALLFGQTAAVSASEHDLIGPSNALEDHFVVAEGVRLHYVTNGTGQPVVLLHGNDGTVKDFTMSIFDKLTAKYQTIAFDRPGHGLSKILTSKEQTPEMQARTLHSALQQLGIQRPLLVGHSWSGALALSYALQFPDDLKGLVLLSGMAYKTKRQEPKAIYFGVRVPVVGTALAMAFKSSCKREIERQLTEAFAPDQAPKSYVDSFLSSFLTLGEFKSAIHDEITINPALKRMSPLYGKIQTPVVIVAGDCDQTVNPELHSFPLHKAIPQSHLIVVHNGGHELQFTHQSDVLRAIDLSLTPAPVATLMTPVAPRD
jgi:pimeloyl-ACP methyl ester carboxylesterase